MEFIIHNYHLDKFSKVIEERFSLYKYLKLPESSIKKFINGKITCLVNSNHNINDENFFDGHIFLNKLYISEFHDYDFSIPDRGSTFI